MPINIESLMLRFDALSQREKLMTVGAVLLLIWSAWDKLFYQPLEKKQRSQASEITALTNQLQVQQQLAERLEHQNLNNPTQQKLAQVQLSVQNLKEQIGAGEKKFVPPQSMANALRDILKQNGNLKLIKLETLPVKPFSGEDRQPAWLYRHTLSLTLQGDFFSTLNYLKSLESLPWRIHWDSIDYRVKNYPLAETQIQVYTLSFEKDWLGA